MRKTPQEFKRENVKKLFDKVLRDAKLRLIPISISASESLDDDFTTTEFSFEEIQHGGGVFSTAASGKGFVDCIFEGLHCHYVNTFPSLEKLKLIDIMVNPIMRSTVKKGSDAKANVVFRVEVDRHGFADFQHQSRSILYSSFSAALDAFQFYINCEKTFDKIQLILEDANKRNRGDIVQSCMADLSKLTEVNTYVQKKN